MPKKKEAAAAPPEETAAPVTGKTTGGKKERDYAAERERRKKREAEKAGAPKEDVFVTGTAADVDTRVTIDDKPVSKADVADADELTHPKSELYAYVEKSYTTKIGDDYAKVVVGVTMPFDATTGEKVRARKAIQAASNMVEEELLSELEKLGVKVKE